MSATKKTITNILLCIVLLYVNIGIFYSIVACVHVCKDESFFGRLMIFVTTFATWPAHILTTKLFY